LGKPVIRGTRITVVIDRAVREERILKPVSQGQIFTIDICHQGTGNGDILNFERAQEDQVFAIRQRFREYYFPATDRSKARISRLRLVSNQRYLKFSVEFWSTESEKKSLARRRKARQVRRNKKIFFFALLASWRDKLC